MKSVFLASLVALCLAPVLASQIQFSPDSFKAWLGRDPDVGSKNSLLTDLLAKAQVFADDLAARYGSTPSKRSEQYPFYYFFPAYVTSVMPGGASYTYASPCFSKTTISASAVANNAVNVTFTVAGGNGCTDIYLLGTLTGVAVQETRVAGSHVVTWSVANLTSSELWDIENEGVRIFRFLEDPASMAYDINMTIALFASYSTPGVDDYTGALNVQFMTDYAWQNYAPRATQEVLLDASQINSGDFLGVIRMDGLDPVLAWAMGTVTGHTTIAIRDPSGTLNICESTVASAYWPTDNIQCLEYTQWISQAKAAGYLVTHAPLSPASRALFNETAAWNYIQTVLGYEYGFYNQFWGWLDTDNDNYPCLPPDWSECLLWQHWQVITGLLDKVAPATCDQFFKQSLNKRLGTSYTSIADIYVEANKQGYTPPGLYNTVELDSYTYKTNRNGQPADGPSMVCCVFVCNVYKHSGLFQNDADQINCGEFTNWDVYSMDIFDSNYQKPPQCVAADPASPTCQLEGAYTLVFNNYNSKDEFPHMAEKCPSQNPYYTKPANC